MSNPYTPGTTEAIAEMPQGTHEAISDMATAKKLYKASRAMISLCYLAAFGIIVMTILVVVLFYLETDEPAKQAEVMVFTVISLLAIVFQFFVVYSLIYRPKIGRVAVIIFCAFNLINVPLGTVIGIYGIWAAVVGKPLFGDQRVTHAELKVFKKNKFQIS